MSEMYREFRIDPATRDKSIVFSRNPIPGYPLGLFDLQSNMNGNKITEYSRGDISVQVISPQTHVFLLEESPRHSEPIDATSDRKSAYGAHEVLIVNKTTPEGIELLIEALISRAKALSTTEKDGSKINQLYAYMTHNIKKLSLYSELFASIEIPPHIEREILGSAHYFNFRGRCLNCDVTKEEQRAIGTNDSRFFNRNKNYISFVPPNTSSPYHLRIIPVKHIPTFMELTSEKTEDLSGKVEDLAKLIYQSIKCIDMVSAENNGADITHVCLHSAPVHLTPILETENYLNNENNRNPPVPLRDYYHFHVEIITFPQQSEIPGSGWTVSTNKPENTAKKLRDARDLLDNQL